MTAPILVPPGDALAAALTVEHEITLTIFGDVAAASCQSFRWSFDELAERLRNVKTYPNKAACPLLKLATFGDQRTDKNSLRHDGNVLEIFGVEGDYDGGKVSLADAQILLFEQSIAAILYTSPSHTEEKPRWRVLAPLSRPYPPSERARFVARLNGALGGILASESFALSQSFYVGRVEGVQYEVAQVRGTCIDQLDELDEKAIGPPKKNGESKADRLNDLRSNDPVIIKLKARGLLLRIRSDGGADLICPFEADHTTPRAPGDCAYFPAHTGGFKRAHFKCLHSHCAERTDDDFLRAIGIEKVAPKETKENEFAEAMTARDVMATASAPTQYCVDGRVPCGVVIIGARPKAKKSWYALQLGIAKAKAGRFMGVATSGGRVLYIALEDNSRRMRKRLEFFGITPDSAPDNLHIFHAWPSGIAGVEKLERWLAKYPDTVLIIIDVLQRFRGGRDPKVSAYEGDYTMMAMLHGVTQRHDGLTILVVHHVRKGAVDDPVEAINGTFAIAGAADAYIILRRGQGEQWIAHIDGRDWESWDHEFAWEFIDREGWRQIGVSEGVSLTATQQEIVKAARDMGCMTPTKLAELRNISKPSAHQHLKALVDKGAMRVYAGKYYANGD